MKKQKPKLAKPVKDKKSGNPLTISNQIEETVTFSINAAAAALAGFEQNSDLGEAIGGAVFTEDGQTTEPVIVLTEDTFAAEGLTLENPEETPESEDKLPQDLQLVQVRSIIESLLLAYDKPINLSLLREVFKGTNTKTDVIKRALSDLMVEYAGAERGMSVSEVGGGYQLRSKSENQVFVRRLTKGRPFRLSGPSLEVLSIVAYKQPIIKSEVDAIRGVESGHLVRALMDRSLVKFVGKSELPGKPMLYGTTRKFLEIFGLRDLRELPSLAEIDDLIPEGMLEDDSEVKEENWETVQDMSLNYQQDYQKDEEWEKITEEISKIETSSSFFEDEKKRERQLRDQERAEALREIRLNGQQLPNKDQKWLERYETALAGAAARFNDLGSNAAVAVEVAVENSPDVSGASEEPGSDSGAEV